MSRRVVSLFAALVVGIGPVAAAGTCPDGTMRDAKKIAEAIDIYTHAPFSARTWRVLRGLGDPGIDENYGDTSFWSNQDRWRKRVSEVAGDIRQPDSYGYDCRLDYPLNVLDKRIGDLGPKHPYVRQWITVEMAVLRACSQQPVNELPPALAGLTGDLKALQDFDRAYQDASRIFYQDRERAIGLFRGIAASASPHRTVARYMIANILANTKQLDAARKEARDILADPTLASAHPITQELLGYIANLEDTPQGWTDLIEDTVTVIERPAKEISGSDKLKADYARALYDIDFVGIRGRSDDWWLDGKLPENPTVSKAILDASRKHAIVSWMMAGQAANEYYRQAPWQMIGRKWEDRTQSLIERAMGLVRDTPPLARQVIDALKARPDDSSRKLLWDQALAAIKSADESCGTSPETAAAGTLLSHAVRLSALAGKFDEAYANLDALPIKTSETYFQYAVFPLGQYLLGTGMVEEGRRYRDHLLTADFRSNLPQASDRAIADRYSELLMWFAEDRDHWLQALAQHSRRADLSLLNFLPTKDLAALATDEKLLPAAGRALLARVAWTRIYARGRTPARSVTEQFLALNPQFKAVLDKVSSDYPKASDQRRRLLFVLRTPRLGILTSAPGMWEPVSMLDEEDPTSIDNYDHNDKNWWCPFETDRHLLQLRSDLDSLTGNGLPPWGTNKQIEPVWDLAVAESLEAKREQILKSHPVVRSINWAEIASLAGMPSAPKRLSLAAIAWGRRGHASTDGAAEALALAVKSTRFGCNWHGGHKSYSKAAHDLLHERFATTSWAAQTPFWFDCANFYDYDPDKKVCKVATWPKQKFPR